MHEFTPYFFILSVAFKKPQTFKKGKTKTSINMFNIYTLQMHIDFA